MIEPFVLPHNFNSSEMNDLLRRAFELQTSDITVQSNEPVWIKVHDSLHRFSDRVLQNNDVRMFISYLYGDAALSLLAGGKDIDHRYDIVIDRQNRIGFRVNATAGYIPGGNGIQITLRTIPGTPPLLSELDINEPEILENISPMQGMVLIVGPTGSGKSTLLSAIMRHKLEETDNRKIITYEAPIEYVYAKVKAKSSVIFQTEVPTHLKSNNEEKGLFADCVRNALRRAPTDILIGEARDAETIKDLIKASVTGHTTYSTVHADSVSDTVTRMILELPETSKAADAYSLINALQLIVVQRLVANIDETKRKVALREYCAFTPKLKKFLSQIPYKDISAKIADHVNSQHTTLFDAAERTFKNGLITEGTFKKFKRVA